MPIGERIGQAYVRVIMDGEDFDEDIERRLDNLDGKFKTAGDSNAKEYRKAYQAAMKDFTAEDDETGTTMLDRLQANLRGQKGRFNAIQRVIREGVFEDLFEDVDFSFDGIDDEISQAVGERLRRNMEQGFADSGDPNFFEGFLNSFPQQVARARKEVVRELETLHREVERQNREEIKEMEALGDETLRLIHEQHEREFEEHVAAAKREFDELIDDHDRDFEQHVRHHRDLAEQQAEADRQRLEAQKRLGLELFRLREEEIRNEERWAKANASFADEFYRQIERQNFGLERARSAAARSRKEFDRLITSTDAFRESVANGEDARTAYVQQVNDLADGLRQVGLFSDRSEKDLQRFHRQVERSSIGVERLRDNASRFERSLPSFGKGARNNFINLFGIALRGAITLLPKLLVPLKQVAESFGRLFTGGVQGIKDFGSDLAGLGASFTKVTVLGLGLGAAIAALAVIFAGPIASLVVGLTAALTALAATISFALIGAIVGATALIAPLVAAIGVGVLAFKGMSKEMKATLDDAMKPLSKEFKVLGENAGDALGKSLPAAIQSLTGVVEKVEPLVTKVARSVGQVLQDVARDLNSSGFQDFADRLGVFLPKAIRRLGESLSNIGQGLGGVFEAAIPQMNRFLNFLVEITQNFADFANSEEGQESLRNFFKRAGDAAVTVFDTLGAIKGLIGTLFDAGNETGTNILESLTENIEQFTQHLNDNPDALKDFFAGGEQVIKDVGDAFIAIGDILGTLDTENSRDTLGDILGLFETLADFLDENQDLVEDVQSIANGIVFAIDLLVAGSQSAGAFVIPPLFDYFKNEFEALGLAWDIAKRVVGEIIDFFENPFGTGGSGGPRGAGALTINPLAIFEDFDISTIVGLFTGIPGAVFAAIKDSVDLGEMFKGVDLGGIASAFIGLPGVILGLLANQVDLSKAFDFPSLSELASFVIGLPAQILASIFQSVDLFDAFEFPDLGEIASHFAGLGPAILAAIGDIIPNISLPDLNPFGGGSGNPQRSGDLPRPSSSPEPAVFTGGALGEPTLFKSPQKVEVEFDLKNSNLISGEVGKLSTDLDVLDGKTAVPTVDVKDREALTKAQTFEQALRDIDGLISSTGLVVDSKGAKKKVDDFSRDVLSVAKLKPTATLQADDGPGNSTLNKLKNALKAYDNLSPEAQLKAKDESTAIVQRIQRLFSQYRSENPTTNIHATSDVDGVVNAARNALDSIDGKTANTYIRTIRVGEGTGGGSGAQGGATQEFGASGGLFTRATNITIGEDGPEALVPLNRALSRVDPAVRDLSAVLQGKVPVQESGRTVTQNITLTTPTTDPAAVAQELLNRVIASAAF